MTDIPDWMRALTHDRAAGRCEYCLIHEMFTFARHEPDHILALQHGGETSPDNLAWACAFCNRHKGPNIASLDPLSGRTVPLFNPRTQQWQRHFRLNGPRIEPLTASGRATASLLLFNIAARIEDRQALLVSGDYP